MVVFPCDPSCCRGEGRETPVLLGHDRARFQTDLPEVLTILPGLRLETSLLGRSMGVAIA